MEPIENYLSLYDPNYMSKISSMDFVIPPDFLNVIMKMNPELNLVEIHSVDNYNMIDAMTMNAHECFRVNLNIQIAKDFYPKGGMTQYGDSITNLFRHTYTDYNFVSFQIKEMKQEPTISNREKFIELFGAK